MSRWIDLYSNVATYISKEYDISSEFESYKEEFSFRYKENGGNIDVYIRTSFDTESWSEWIKINDSLYGNLFRDDFYGMEYGKVQFKIEMTPIGIESPVFESFSFALVGSHIIENTGDVVCKPELWIKKINGSGTVKLINETSKEILILTDLNNNETVFIDCENEDIESDLPLTYRYDNHNNVFLKLGIGENVLSGEGDFELTLRYEFKTLQG